MPQTKTILIVTPSLANANNGNWRTAHRWQSFLNGAYRVIVAAEVSRSLDLQSAAPDLLVVLHARRSHQALLDFRAQFPGKPTILVLTGTDLYADLETSAEAQDSVSLADALVVLQQDAIRHVPAQFRRKTHVIYQSARTLSATAKPSGRLRCVVVGHLRNEKSPQTIFAAARKLDSKEPIHITHIGDGLDATLAERARTLSAQSANYRWVGGLSHGLTRAAIKRSHLLLHPSLLEGGANVIAEAVTAGTPVLASKMSGNVGMLGETYDGYFPVGDADALLGQMRACLRDANFYARLNTACKARASLFRPDEERRRLTQAIAALLD